MSVQFQDYYATLGVSKDASQDAIKKAFRQLARKYHPDHARAEDKSVAETKFKAINEAYEVLGDAEKRRKYDQLGVNWQQYERAGAEGGRPGGWQTHHHGGAGGQQDYEFHFGGTGFSDFFEQYFGMGGGRSPFGKYARSSADASTGFSMRGHDVEAELLVTLEEALKGSRRQISLRKVDPQTGRETAHTYQVRIPAGVREGQRIRLAGQGEAGFGQASSGDLFLRVRLAQHPFLRVQGDTLYYNLEITPWEAVLGASVSIETLDGAVKVKIQPGSQNGQHLRLRGLGLPKKDSHRGDLHVVLLIEVPPTATPEEKRSWEALAKTSSFNPRKI